MAKGIEIPQVPPEQQTALVQELLALIARLAQRIQEQDEQIEQLEDEVAVLKGEKKRPQFKPSRLDPGTDPKEEPAPGESSKRPGSAKRSKTAELAIDEERIIAPSEPIPPGSRFKGYRDVVVQDLIIRCHTIRYRLARWLTPDGRSLSGRLPAAIGRRHFGPTLAGYVLYQHHHCQVTQPLLREQLREWGVAISAGQIDALLTADKETFHQEKDAVLATGLSVSDYVTVDDTGARHRGRNGYTTHIGNDFFAWFASTAAKSRINFLELLRAGHTDYRIDAQALASMQHQGLAQAILRRLREHPQRHFADRPQWETHLEKLGIGGERHRRIATEGALLASVLHHGLPPDLVIVSDDAGQFDLLQHGLCWVHAERLIHKLIALNEEHRQDIAAVRSQVWSLYADLKAYKTCPHPAQATALRARFEAIFTQKTRFATLDQTLKRIHRNRDELLRVLDHPTIPLHTNGSETAIRDYVKKKKVSGGTRSDLGRQCRDTFTSLKKTCRKLGVSFWQYLSDRLFHTEDIPPLPDLIRQRASPG
jgi:hypothetical protein